MKLSQRAIEIIGGKDQQPTRLKLALALGFSERWVERLIESNKPNSSLTTVAALEVITAETGLSQNDVLENGNQVAA